MKILLISGHGGGDSGACAKIDKVQYKESDETIKMVELIAKYLDDVDIYPTSRNAFKDLKSGCLKADLKKYDYVLEIHFNACVNDLKGNAKTSGTEIYVPKAETSTSTETKIVNAIEKFGLKNRGAKKYNWSVINRAKALGTHSALLEICFIDDKDDMDIYLANREKIAKAIAEVLGGKASTSSSKSFKVKCLDDLNIRKTPGGEITTKNGCKKGTVYTITKTKDNWGYLKSGAGWIKISSKYVTRV